MPSDEIDDNDEHEPTPSADTDAAERIKRREARNATQNWEKKAGGRQGTGRDATMGTDGTGPAAAALPIVTANQVEILLAKRQQRLKTLLIRLGLFVALPTFVVWFYAALIATPRYACNFELTYQAYLPASSLTAGLVQSDVGTSVTDSIDYGTLLYEYIRSLAAADQVDSQINVRKHYSRHGIDVLSRLAPNATQGAFLAYWRNHVVVSEGFGGYLTIQTQGFDPAFTLLLAQTISADANDMIDGLNKQARQSGFDAATTQLKIAAAGLQKATDALRIFRNGNGDLDPSFAATELATIVGSLESQLALLRAQLGQANANMQPNASQIVQLKLQIGAMEQQIASERQRLSDNGAPSYSDTVALYDDLTSDQLFANTIYQAAQQGLIIAQAAAVSKQNYAVDFVQPVLPTEATLPDPFISSLTIFLVLISLYGISTLLLAAFRDQSGI